MTHEKADKGVNIMENVVFTTISEQMVFESSSDRLVNIMRYIIQNWGLDDSDASFEIASRILLNSVKWN